MTSAVRFDYSTHCLVLPVQVCGIEAKFIFDTGIGLNLISEDLAAQANCQRDGSTFTGRRMSGQAVTMPLGSLKSLQIGANPLRDVTAGIVDTRTLAGLGEIQGFVSLTCFRTTPVTIDYRAGLVIIEDERRSRYRQRHADPQRAARRRRRDRLERSGRQAEEGYGSDRA